MHHDVTEEELKQARHPHELFLINLIFNHILMFAASLGVARSYPLLLLPIPTFSAAVMLYTLWRARRSLVTDSWFVACHWQVAARRSRMLLALLGAVVVVVAAILLVAGGNPRPQHWALLGGVILPGMVTILVLIMMETESMQQARQALVPQWVMDRFPKPASSAASV